MLMNQFFSYTTFSAHYRKKTVLEILLFLIKTPLIEELEKRRQHYLDLKYCE